MALLIQLIPSFGELFNDKLYLIVPLVQSPILTLSGISQLPHSKFV